MSKKILLADDSITIQKVIELTFSDEDFEVVTVGNGRLALEKLADVKPDIVLCDIIMPETDGYEVCQRVKSDPQTAHIPVLLLTGAFEPFDQERASRVGSDGFLAKPFEPETLITKVKDLLGRTPGRAAAPASAARAEPPAPGPPPAPPPPPRAAPPQVAAPPTPPPAPAPPAAPAPRAAPEPQPLTAASAFIPEEPFDAFDAEAIEAQPSAPGAPEPELAPVTPEESATLAGAPEPPPEASPADAASTVMFRADDLPWTTAGGERAPQPPVHEAAPPEVEPELEPLGVEPEVEPEPYPPPGGPDESGSSGAAFEEVLEEDLEFGTGLPSPAPAPPAAPAAESYEPARRPPPAETTQAVPPRSDDETSTGRFRVPDVKPPSATETTPPLAPEAAEPVLVPRDAPMEPPLGAEGHATPAPEEWKPTPERAPAPPVESFADVQPEVAEPEPSAAPASGAASVPVPVDMVEKIAQRVVAQVSERVVREIAWEVFPDLAEALIKQEIERLKAELQKL
jgi:CheY-like chemotaxis protein